MAADEDAGLTHLDARGAVRMVDVGAKPSTDRRARAEGWLQTRPEVVAAVLEGRTPKGDVAAVVRVAAILAAKRTAEWIPLAHPLPLSGVEVEVEPQPERGRIGVRATVATHGPTGVEMEALTAVTAGLLTAYDMLKALDRGMVLGPVRLLEKSGGRTGHYRAPGQGGAGDGGD
ncbi:molybdenum cofactor biosynthesis protein C [Candidatus Hydrogenisulfobacillus filiaventi]|uniref:Cyclic pyranopterin monophosphate synthase n=1 Tax=Candidatus Hydrogenisulfobacillus filiaventi TaxID=2707344 RepID=A0A6F8ZHZ3_9FIRM|nr:cyclic pyranopterin monophosphate synthase MoaC [Bacillota bacterium]CAB1129272.1 molybdenum cofactor biosynthesis protein C [Candidatus Hydrogenisulfobacillus filiaventi]